MRLLIVEDEPDLRDLLASGLRQASYAVDLAADCARALRSCETTAYDVVVLDLGLPDGNGLDVCRELATSQTLCRPNRILIVTARDAVEQRIAGLDAGADDYLVKPFVFAELLARLRSLSRRQDVRAATVTIGDLSVDLGTQEVRRAGVEIDLPAREFALLRSFVHHPNQVLPAEALLDHVWDAHADPMTTSVRVILSRLRKKLGSPSPILTETGAGYRLVEA